ncbi:MAG: LamG domain-containing protein [Nitrosarchaeum sp.]|nr:LamG domain-containing protein [Nitrosarchaeum sp.]
MAIFYNPRTVTDGLVLALDAANPKSYPGSGTTWTDLSGINSSGELVNSPVYNSSNLGFFQFVTDDFARIANNTALDTQTPTVEVWVKTNATTQNGFWFEKGTVNSQYSLFQEGTGIQWRMNIGGVTNLTTTTATYINTSNWYQVVGTYTSGSRRLYINGVLVNSDAQTGTIATDSGGMSIGAYGGFSGSRGYYYNGNLSICRVYNRALTAAEVSQNYNALKSRYEL